jgi:hypothetical protein
MTTPPNNETNYNNTVSFEVVKLPEWKSCLQDMLDEGVEYGKSYDAEYFEKRLKQDRMSMRFSLDVSRIRSELLRHGYYLSGRGGKGEVFEIVPAADNSGVMEQFQAAAAQALKRGVILGTNTRVDMLSDAERRRHDSILEKLAIRTALFSRRVPTLKKAMLSLNDKKSKAA